MRPLLLLVIAEFVVLVLLAMQWGAGGTTALANDQVSAPAKTPAAAATPAAADLTNPRGAGALAERTPAATPDARVAPNDPFGILLGGTVRGTDGTLVEGANVGMRRDREYHTGNSAAPGAFAIARLQPGEWTLTCRADGFVPHEAPCVLDERAFQRVDIELQPSWIVRVKVLGADGKSIVEELEQKVMFSLPYVVATVTPLAGDLPPTEHSSLSRFGLGEWSSYGGLWGKQPKLKEEGYCGELRLHRAPPVHASLLLRTTLLQCQRIEPGQKELVFTIEAEDVLSKHATVKLRLVDGTTGNPIAGANVNVRTSAGGGTMGKTGDDGRAIVEPVLPGINMLECDQRSAEQEGLFRYIRVPAGGTVDLGDITLTAHTKIKGCVVDGDGKPVNGAVVQFTELDCRSFAQPLVDFRSASTDADGKFEIWGSGRHRYVVLARSPQNTDYRTGFATVDATRGAPAAVTIKLAKPTTVNLNAGFDMTVGRVVTALASDGSPAAVATLGAAYRPKSMSLVPGSYTIQIHDLQTDRLVRSLALQVGGEPLTIDVP